MAESAILDRLYEVILDRKGKDAGESYVASLLAGGRDAIAAKVREECEETIEAAGEGDADHLANEVADLLFHTWVLMANANLKPSEVYAVLEGRFGVSGHSEKAARAAAPTKTTDGAE